MYQKYFESNSDKSSWKQGTVGDVLQLQRGHDLPRTEMTGGKYPVAGSTGTIGYHDEFTAEAPVIVMGRSAILATQDCTFATVGHITHRSM